MCLRFRGGCEFADLSNEKSKEIIKFSDKAPKWRMACNGLNIEGICKNKNCIAYQKQVIC